MLDDLNAGKGTAGKLLKDEELYQQLNQIAAKLNSAVDKINSGQGTIGQLVVNPQLYESLNGATREAAAAGQGHAPESRRNSCGSNLRYFESALVVNADDFGFTRDVNEGIVEAHREGILTSTTLMANGDAFEHAVELARETPTLDIGCHLTLIGGEALTGGPLPRTAARLVAALLARRIPVYEEFAAQVRRIQAAGLRPTHLDTHKHTHLAPPVLRALARIAVNFRIPWIRRTLLPFPMPAHCRTTDHFVGFRLTGRMGPAEMDEALRKLRPGFTEFMCHPGYCRSELLGAPTRLKESRQRELEALVSARVRHTVQERGILLTPFS